MKIKYWSHEPIFIGPSGNYDDIQSGDIVQCCVCDKAIICNAFRGVPQMVRSQCPAKPDRSIHNWWLHITGKLETPRRHNLQRDPMVLDAEKKIQQMFGRFRD